MSGWKLFSKRRSCGTIIYSLSFDGGHDKEKFARYHFYSYIFILKEVIFREVKKSFPKNFLSKIGNEKEQYICTLSILPFMVL